MQNKSDQYIKIKKPSDSYVKYKRAMQRFSQIDTWQLQEKWELLLHQLNTPSKIQNFDIWEGKAVNISENNRSKEDISIFKKPRYLSSRKQKSKIKNVEKISQPHMSLSNEKSIVLNSDLEHEINK